MARAASRTSTRVPPRLGGRVTAPGGGRGTAGGATGEGAGAAARMCADGDWTGTALAAIGCEYACGRTGGGPGCGGLLIACGEWGAVAFAVGHDGIAFWIAPGPTGGSGERDPRSVVEPSSSRAERDLVAVLEQHLAAHALAVDVGAVQAAEVAQDEPAVADLDDAVLLRDDLVEELDRVVRVAPEAVGCPQIRSLAVLPQSTGAAWP